MERTFNSVQQIVTECNNMIKISRECEYQDIKLLASTLDVKVKELKELFDSNPEKEHEIETLKISTEEIAIRLEFYVAHRLHELVDRYELRKEAKKIYDYCRRKVLTLKDATEEEVLNWSMYSRWAIKYYARSLHILFEEVESDKEIISVIRNMIIEED